MGFKVYTAVAHVLLRAPVPSDDGITAIAYYRLFLVSASSADAAMEAIASDTAEDGLLDRSDVRIVPVDVAKLDSDMRSHYPGPAAEGIWYRSGKGYHG